MHSDRPLSDDLQQLNIELENAKAALQEELQKTQVSEIRWQRRELTMIQGLSEKDIAFLKTRACGLSLSEELEKVRSEIDAMEIVGDLTATASECPCMGH
jgi:hypothetical protein